MRMRKLWAVLICMGMLVSTAFAQSGGPTMTPAGDERSIGFDCPVAQALSPDGETLWVLMRGCFSRSGYALLAFNAADGEPVALEADYTEALEPLREGEVIGSTNPMGFMDANTLSIRYSERETYAVRSVALTLDGQPAVPMTDDESLMALLSQYAEYPEFSIYSDDHRLAFVVGSASAHVLDVVSGEELFSVSYPAETYNAYPTFSPDSSIIYIAQLIEPENFESYESVLTAYSLPDGAVIDSWPVPSPFVWVSPDGRYAAAEIGANDGTSSDLLLANLETGGVSAPLALFEPPRRAVACVNDGRSLSDVDFTVSGTLALIRVNWLGDSSGFVYTRSSGGEAVGGGRPCALDSSRLNRVTVSG